MADNVAFTPGTGATGATDDIGGVHYPRVKATWGPDGTANDTDVATGKPLPAQIRSATGLIPIGEPTDDKSTATDTTSVSMISLLKQISASVQAFVAGIVSLGRAAAAASTPTVWSNEDLAAVSVRYVDVTMSMFTSAAVSLDLLADVQAVAACTRANDEPGILQSLQLLDEDDNKAALKVLFFSASTTLGTEGDAINLTDALGREFLGLVDIAVGDYTDLGGCSVVSKNGLGIVVKPATGTDDIYVAIMNGTGTPTYTASGIRLRMGFI